MRLMQMTAWKRGSIGEVALHVGARLIFAIALVYIRFDDYTR
jgi:hypothetical protein